MTYFTGIDVSSRPVSIGVIDEAGEVRHEAKVAAAVEVKSLKTLKTRQVRVLLTSRKDDLG